jgi:hypothetical protein
MSYAAGIPPPATIGEDARMAGSAASLEVTIFNRPTVGGTKAFGMVGATPDREPRGGPA